MNSPTNPNPTEDYASSFRVLRPLADFFMRGLRTSHPSKKGLPPIAPFGEGNGSGLRRTRDFLIYGRNEF